jgi:hypothetical protein
MYSGGAGRPSTSLPIGPNDKPINPERGPADVGPAKFQLLRILREAVVIDWILAVTPLACS